MPERIMIVGHQSPCSSPYSYHAKKSPAEVYSAAISFGALRYKMCLLIMALVLAATSKTHSQMRPTLEVKTYMQFDWYKKFLAHRGELTETYVRIESTSIGASLTYKAPMQQDLSLNIGLGYYKYNFNRIQNINSMHGISDARGTTFTDAGVFLAKRCDAYWYHTVDGIIGIEKRYRFKERMFAAGSISLHNYFSFSRAYHIDEELSQPGKENPYKRNGFKFFGLSATADVLVARSYGRFLLGPVLMIPVFKMWKKDSSFINEDDTGTRSHWFRGVAGGISLQYSL